MKIHHAYDLMISAKSQESTLAFLVGKEKNMSKKYVAPSISGDYLAPKFFTCPLCNTLCQHKLVKMTTGQDKRREMMVPVESCKFHLSKDEAIDIFNTKCFSCNSSLLWKANLIDENNDGCVEISEHQQEIIFPDVGVLPVCNDDTPERAKILYREAAAVSRHSKRASATLIRVAMEMLLQDAFGLKGNLFKIIENNQDKLGELYDIAHALRLIGNDGAHPDVKTIDLEEDVDGIIEGLFLLFNDIVEELFTKKRRQKETMNKIGKAAKQKIPSHEVEEATNTSKTKAD